MLLTALVNGGVRGVVNGRCCGLLSYGTAVAAAAAAAAATAKAAVFPRVGRGRKPVIPEAAGAAALAVVPAAAVAAA